MISPQTGLFPEENEQKKKEGALEAHPLLFYRTGLHTQVTIHQPGSDDVHHNSQDQRDGSLEQEHQLVVQFVSGQVGQSALEPFVDLLKSSMNTFLNAFTYQDKTVYPVSSRNSRDFLNLTEVYLDAVFDPALLKNPNIFYQEGRHIEQDEDGNDIYTAPDESLES